MSKGVCRNEIYRVALVMLITASLAFCFFIIQGKGYFYLTGDFNRQQITFVTAMQQALREQNGGEWYWGLDLGSSFITGFSFYDLGSPFTWICMAFPPGSFPYLAGWMFILKYTAAGLFAYLYLRLFIKNENSALIGAMLYAFSGYQAVNLEFYHFHDIVAFFPLLLLALEKYTEDHSFRGLFCFAVFINCITNYYFFIEEAVFLIIYFLIRNAGKTRDFFIRNIPACLACGLLGTGMAAALFIPNVLFVLGNSRASVGAGMSDLISGVRESAYVIKGMLLPAEPMLEQSAVFHREWSSTSCYLPLFGMSFALAYVRRERDWLKWMLIILTVMSFSPFAQSCFLMFTEANQRWWFMYILMLALATAQVLDEPERYRIRSSIVICLLCTAAFWLLAQVGNMLLEEQVIFMQKRLLFSLVVAAAGLISLLFLCRPEGYGARGLVAVTMAFCVLTTATEIYTYRGAIDPVMNSTGEKRSYLAGLGLEEKEDAYRFNTGNNFYTLPANNAGIAVFSTTIENSSREFDHMFDINSGNTTGGRMNVPGLPALLAGKWSVEESSGDGDLIVTENAACPIGFAVSSYITEDDLLSLPLELRAAALMQAAVVSREDESHAAEVAERIEPGSINTDIDEGISLANGESVTAFSRDGKGFRCVTRYGSPRLVFFSVPYDKGWSAETDGEPAKLMRSGGMMAAVVPAGRHEVGFTYRTPLFKEGLMVSAVSFAVFLLAVIAGRKKNRRKDKKIEEEGRVWNN